MVLGLSWPPNSIKRPRREEVALKLNSLRSPCQTKRLSPRPVLVNSLAVTSASCRESAGISRRTSTKVLSTGSPVFTCRIRFSEIRTQCKRTRQAYNTLASALQASLVAHLTIRGFGLGLLDMLRFLDALTRARLRGRHRSLGRSLGATFQ